MKRLILMRHGESTWNRDGLFTGWSDVDLTDTGRSEARRAGQLLRNSGLHIAVAYTSLLSRASETLRIVCEEMNRPNMPMFATDRLNERHYGALEGLSKSESAEIFGAAQVHLWRRSYLGLPPSLREDDARYLAMKRDPRYRLTTIPRTESLADAIGRLRPYWEQEIRPSLVATGAVLIVTHGNLIRGLIRDLEGLSNKEFESVEVPTAEPRVYEFYNDSEVHRVYYLNSSSANTVRCAA